LAALQVMLGRAKEALHFLLLLQVGIPLLLFLGDLDLLRCSLAVSVFGLFSEATLLQIAVFADI
jgi:hypothetical protein